jgi:pimeloyl-ACP methyl ester carboxylesterase
MAALLIARRRVERLLLRAPALIRDVDLEIPLGRRQPSTPDEARIALGNLRKFAGAVLVLESGHDEEVPHETVQAYLDACHGHAAYEVIPDATHSLTDEAWQRQFIDTIVIWFAPMVSAATVVRSASGEPRLQR